LQIAAPSIINCPAFITDVQKMDTMKNLLTSFAAQLGDLAGVVNDAAALAHTAAVDDTAASFALPPQQDLQLREAAAACVNQRTEDFKFSECQYEAVASLMRRHNLFLRMVTGGGKSLTWAVLAKEPIYETRDDGWNPIILVMEPTSALKEDQVRSLRRMLGSDHCVAMTGASGGGSTEVEAHEVMLSIDDLTEAPVFTEPVYADIIQQHTRVRVVYLVPEKLACSKECQLMLYTLMKRGQLAYIVYDEAHLYLEWMLFRPLMHKVPAKLQSIYRMLPDDELNTRTQPISYACTSTATPVVRHQLKKIFGLGNDCVELVSSCDRKELKFVFENMSTMWAQKHITLVEQMAIAGMETVFSELSTLDDDSSTQLCGIIFVTRTKDADRVAACLKRAGYTATSFHSGDSLPEGEAMRRFNVWVVAHEGILVSSTAGSVGVSNRYCRFVLSLTMRLSIMPSFQEWSRCGRLKQLSVVVIAYHPLAVLSELSLASLSSASTAGSSISDELESASSLTMASLSDEMPDMLELSTTTSQCRRKMILRLLDGQDLACSHPTPSPWCCDNCSAGVTSSRLWGEIDCTEAWLELSSNIGDTHVSLSRLARGDNNEWAMKAEGVVSVPQTAALVFQLIRRRCLVVHMTPNGVTCGTSVKARRLYGGQERLLLEAIPPHSMKKEV
jgi:superfamily II DNA helicase RecQ